MNFKVLNTKEVKRLLNKIEKEYLTGKLKLDYIFLENNENKIFILSKDFIKLDRDRLRINKIGLYLCKIENDGVRLSIEGSQLVGKYSRKTIELNDDEIEKWTSGENIKKDSKNGYFIVKYRDDFYGVTRIKENLLRNFIPKDRRIKKKLKLD